MAIDLRKKSRINLKKRTFSISLRKDFYLGNVICCLKGGYIDHGNDGKGASTLKPADLDACLVLFNEDNNLLDRITPYSRLLVDDGSITHSGDNRKDLKMRGEMFDEIIEIKLSKVNIHARNIFFMVNSSEGHDLSKLQDLNIKIYEGDKKHIKQVLFDTNSAKSYHYSGKSVLVMGRLHRHRSVWTFEILDKVLNSNIVINAAKEIKSRFLS